MSGLLISLLLFTALVLGARAGQRIGFWHAEGTRKLVHTGMGLICLSFPWIFPPPWEKARLYVWILAGLAILILFLLRSRFLRHSLGQTLHSVERLSFGDLLFPVAVATVFTAAHGNLVLYIIPLLLLTLADALGALAGQRYGVHRFQTAGGFKSLEGCMVFFCTSFFCCFLSLLVFDHDFYSAALVSLGIALFFTYVEGLSGAGMDNFLVPVGACYLLEFYVSLNHDALTLRIAIFLSLLVLVLLSARATTLDGGSLLAGAIFGMGLFFLGHPACLLSALLLFLISLFVTRQIPRSLNVKHSLDAMTAIMFVPVGVLLLDFPPLLCVGSLACLAGILHGGTNALLERSAIRVSLPVKLALVLSPAALLHAHLSFYAVTLAWAIMLSLAYRQLHRRDDWVLLGAFNLAGTALLHFMFYGNPTISRVLGQP